MYFTYILECSDKTLYTGYTNNLEKRLKNHNEGKGAKYTRGRIPVVLKYYEKFDKKEDAIKREIFIKKQNKAFKINLINNFSE